MHLTQKNLYNISYKKFERNSLQIRALRDVALAVRARWQHTPICIKRANIEVGRSILKQRCYRKVHVFHRTYPLRTVLITLLVKHQTEPNQSQDEPIWERF